ncbi:MAG: Enolase [candidate division WWE3 bacterium GW2011_GWA1_46_21]|uniref:Enolase n=2 Tax=Katanobacteria TaxID=422282 RepID=A0A0G1PD07_UNCKA|nr:MAG: Enolase [candidate division WWE3 bacterium GW2011_GWA1_46_21]KKU57449.1 MAG: Enolase [candidate division WWE3 bacterium GW2011_GWB1_47_11]
MSRISNIKCHKLVNSRGDWTIQTRVELEDGSVGSQVVPEGASKGEHEAVYIPVGKAVDVVTSALGSVLHGEDVFDQQNIDKILVEVDGTENKRNLGANSILSVSLAAANAAAKSLKIPLYKYLGKMYGNSDFAFPTPLFNVFNGGKHAYNNLSFQEFIVIPAKRYAFDKAYEIGVDVYDRLEKALEAGGHDTDVGDEGGFAPSGFTTSGVFELLRKAARGKYKVGDDIFFGCDIAADSFREMWRYLIHEENLSLNTQGLFDYHQQILSENEIIYYEDPFAENDERGWELLMKEFKDRALIVADDLTVTNAKLLKGVIKKGLANAVIVKPNQIGTLTETMEFIEAAKKANMAIVVSHRSGDSAEDTFIADLALAVRADFIKAGAPARGERVAKYNRLLDIYYDKFIDNVDVSA